jgi:diguanylate cyclase (GGDEF)-like protein
MSQGISVPIWIDHSERAGFMDRMISRTSRRSLFTNSAVRSDASHHHAWSRKDFPGTSSILPLGSGLMGMIVSFMVVAGGLYWINATGLLTASALRSVPMSLWGAAVLAIGALSGLIVWGMRSPKTHPIGWFVGGQSKLAIPTTYDSVTGLPTSRLFMSMLNNALVRADREGRHVAILLVELEHFTLTGGSQEPGNPNLIYRVQAARVKSALRSTDTVARLAERTFVVLLDKITADEAVGIATKMQATVSLPFLVEGQEVFLTSRIGISVSGPGAMDGATLLRTAEEAVEKARAEGFVIYGLNVDMANDSSLTPVTKSTPQAA